jgi:hypothetical protein
MGQGIKLGSIVRNIGIAPDKRTAWQPPRRELKVLDLQTLFHGNISKEGTYWTVGEFFNSILLHTKMSQNNFLILRKKSPNKHYED